MKFNVSSKALQQQLVAVSKVINSKNVMSILDNFLFKIDSDLLTITGSDNENTVTATVEIMEVEGAGIVALPAKQLLDIMKEIANQPLTFIINDMTKEVEIQYMNGHLSFMGITGEDFPLPGEFSGDTTTFTLSVDVVAKGLERTLYAVCLDTIRPVMTGVLWDVKKDYMTFVSSDTRRLVRYINKTSQPGIEAQFVLPSKPATILKGLMTKNEGNVVITMDSCAATFEFENYKISCRFINGVYPNYTKVIPENNPFELIADRVTLLNATRRIALAANMTTGLVKLNLQPNELLLSSEDTDYAKSGEERLTCEYSGNSMTIGFNADFIVDVLGNMDAETIILKLSDPTRPGLFVPLKQEDNEDELILVMPLQLMNY